MYNLYERVIVPPTLNRPEAWGMRNDERRRVNILELKYLRSLVGVSRIDRVTVIGMERCVQKSWYGKGDSNRGDQRVLS